MIVEGIHRFKKVFYEDGDDATQWCAVSPNDRHLWAHLRDWPSMNPEHNVRVFFCQFCLEEVEKRV